MQSLDNSTFKNMLAKAICDDSDDEEDNSQICLITHEKLTESSVKLCCGHSFNYYPLFKEVFKQKKTHQSYETTRLKVYQFKCPYCRTLQDGVLPYKPDIVIEHIFTVNSPSSKVIKNNVCKYTFKSGKRKNQNCNKMCYGEYCPGHAKMIERSKNKKSNVVDKEKRCLALTKKGTQCSRNKKLSCNFCAQHEKNQNCKVVPQQTLNVVTI